MSGCDFRYGAGIINWKESELKGADRKTIKTITMYGPIHSNGDVDRLYIKKGRGERTEQCRVCG